MTSHMSEQLLSKIQQTAVWAKMQRKGNSCALLVGMQTGVATMENAMKIPQKIKNRTTI